MSSIFAEIGDDILALIKGAGKTVVPIILSDVQVAVAGAKQAPLGSLGTVGTLAQSLIQIFEPHTGMTGSQKMAAVVGALIPVVLSVVASGGIGPIEGAVEDFVRELAQSAYNDLQANLAKVAANAVTTVATDLAQAA